MYIVSKASPWLPPTGKSQIKEEDVKIEITKKIKTN